MVVFATGCLIALPLAEIAVTKVPALASSAWDASSECERWCQYNLVSAIEHNLVSAIEQNATMVLPPSTTCQHKALLHLVH